MTDLQKQFEKDEWWNYEERKLPNGTLAENLDVFFVAYYRAYAKWLEVWINDLLKERNK